MCRIIQSESRRKWIGFALLPMLMSTVAIGQEAVTKPVRSVYIGEVNANDVYVRSGPSLNHYTVTKLQAGDRVRVVGETGDWLEILPTQGIFSLISSDYVDRGDGAGGVVNGNNVRVRCGSLLNESKYTVQKLLTKGNRVQIRGQNKEGFFLIEPPDGVTVWVHRKFVVDVPEALVKDSDRVAPAAGSPTTGSITAGVPNETVESGQTVKAIDTESADNSLDEFPGTPQRERLSALDRRAQAELAKPVVQRQFRSIIENYVPIAEQTEDEFARRYATARIERLTNMAELVETVRQMRELSGQAESHRRSSLEERAKIREKLPPIPSGWDVQGELRKSAAYPEGSFPRRYRLVDTSSEIDLTIGYVEVPDGSSLDLKGLLGRYVGVRVSGKKLLTGGVDAVPIFVAAEVLALDRPDDSSSQAESGD